MSDSLISKLREPKVHITEGVDVAVFDVSATVLGGYVVAKVMDWSPLKTIPAMFIVGHLVHNATGTSTPLSTKINQTFTEDPDKININNSLEPVQKNEVRFSTF